LNTLKLYELHAAAKERSKGLGGSEPEFVLRVPWLASFEC